MIRTRTLRRLVVAAAFLTATATLVAFADQGDWAMKMGTQGICYCGCDHAFGSRHCVKMCEIPKYENRWWAQSCHKPAHASPSSTPTHHQSHSTRRNRAQAA